jgi:hypothetical protein
MDGEWYDDACDCGGKCPLCCMATFAPGSEECVFCEHHEECENGN